MVNSKNFHSYFYFLIWHFPWERFSNNKLQRVDLLQIDIMLKLHQQLKRGKLKQIDIIVKLHQQLKRGKLKQTDIMVKLHQQLGSINMVKLQIERRMRNTIEFSWFSYISLFIDRSASELNNCSSERSDFW